MGTIEVQVKLIIKKNQDENIETPVYASIKPVGRDEFLAAGQKGSKPSFMAEVWGFEYADQTGLIYNGKEYVIYRTYGPKSNGKMELYAEERVGKR